MSYKVELIKCPDDGFAWKRNDKLQQCPWNSELGVCGSWCPFFSVSGDDKQKYIQIDCANPIKIFEVSA